jgi:hypothetical protein
MYRVAARRVCRCHGMDRDEAQQPPPTCWLPHLVTATGATGCATSGVALHLCLHQGCRRGAQVFCDEDPVSRIAFHIKGRDAPRSAHRFRRYQASMLSTQPNMCANRNWCFSARCPLNARPNSFCCFTWINGVDLRYGSTADQGRTGREDSSSRLWRPARAPGTHAKQSPSTGHSAVGLRQGGEMSPDAEATFHRAIMHAW